MQTLWMVGRKSNQMVQLIRVLCFFYHKTQLKIEYTINYNHRQTAGLVNVHADPKKNCNKQHFYANRLLHSTIQRFYCKYSDVVLFNKVLILSLHYTMSTHCLFWLLFTSPSMLRLPLSPPSASLHRGIARAALASRWTSLRVSWKCLPSPSVWGAHLLWCAIRVSCYRFWSHHKA